MRVLIAPDCFGDTLTAVEAARAVARGWGRGRPGDELVLAPQSDGGPGFVDVLAAAGTGMTIEHNRVDGPLDTRVDAAWMFDAGSSSSSSSSSRSEPTAYLESAQACGLALLPGPPDPGTALAAHSRGVGHLIGAALDRGARTVVVGLGGSCCTDGGRGMVAVLGGPAVAATRLAGVRLVAATDVDHPLLGRTGAAAVFGPQKGADPAAVAILEQRLADWADELEAATGRSVRGDAGAGAAGGLGAALLALGARRESGAAVVAARTGLAAEIAAADLIVTGEGRLDQQWLRGKVVGTLAGRGRSSGTPVLVLAGQIALGGEERRAAGITDAHAVAAHAGSVRRAMDDAAGQLAGLAEATAAGLDRE